MSGLNKLILIILIGLCGYGIVVILSARPQKIDPSKGSIEMVQPCGWIWCEQYDQHTAEHVNQPNSQANNNNAQANLANAQATKTAAEAYRVQSQTAQGQAENFGAGMWAGACVMGLVGLTILGGIVVFITKFR